MQYPITELAPGEFPPLLTEIPQPPVNLRYRGALPLSTLTLLSVVGSRRYTSYGKEVIEHLIGGLAGAPVGIVSGLALGIDSLAHEAALRHRLYTLAIPGGGLDDSVLYPAKHRSLVYQILDAGGGLLSEFEPMFKATTWSFPQRNRLVAGISQATLLIEAGEKSGTLITARLATDYNRELLVVPGNIFSANSRGIHQFLKLGATPITHASDILEALRLEVADAPLSKIPPQNLSEEEQRVLSLLHEPLTKDELIRTLGMPASAANMLLMQMEITGLISESSGYYRAVI